MDFQKIDLTEVVDKMAEAALDKGEGEGAWEQTSPLAKQHARQIMLDLLLPGLDAFEAVMRHVIADELRAFLDNLAEEMTTDG